MILNSSRSRKQSRERVSVIHRPWIPPPAKTSRMKKLNLETPKKHLEIKNEIDTLQDIQQKVSDLDIFVKSLDSVLGKIRTNETAETKNDVTEHKIKEEIIASSKFIENVDHIKVKEYKKKIKLLLKVFHLTELETKKLRQLLEEKDTDLAFLIKDRDQMKLKLIDSNRDKVEIEFKLENITQRIIEMERAQTLSSLKVDKDQIRVLNKELEKLKEENKVLENRMAQKEDEMNKLKEKLSRTLQDSKKENKVVESKSPNAKPKDLEKLRYKVKTLENQNCAFQNALKLMEKQLDDANVSISRLTSDLNKTEKILNKTKLEEKQFENSVKEDGNLSRSVLIELKGFQEEITEKRIRISLLEESLERKTQELLKLSNDKAKIKSEYETKLKDCERQLAVSINTNRSLQNYLTHLKNSYASVFSQPNF